MFVAKSATEITPLLYRLVGSLSFNNGAKLSRNENNGEKCYKSS